jgi:hypothetical protein
MDAGRFVAWAPGIAASQIGRRPILHTLVGSPVGGLVATLAVPAGASRPYTPPAPAPCRIRSSPSNPQPTRPSVTDATQALRTDPGGSAGGSAGGSGNAHSRPHARDIPA